MVNAHLVKHVPGRKTDIADSEWLAQLGRFGLVRGSFIPPKDLRELRLVSRYRKKLSGVLAGEKNRMHKLLDDAGIKRWGRFGYQRRLGQADDRRSHCRAIPGRIGHPTALATNPCLR